MPFPTVSVGQKIRASWGNSAAARFNEADALVQLVPVANTDASTGAEADWLTLGNVTVPSWAVSAIVSVYIDGIIPLTAAGSSYQLRTRLGASMLATNSHYFRDAVPVGTRGEKVSYADRITTTVTGSQAVTVRAARAGGTGQWRLDTLGRATAVIRFLDT